MSERTESLVAKCLDELTELPIEDFGIEEVASPAAVTKAEPPKLPPYIDAVDLLSRHPELNPVLIEGFIRFREVANIIAPPKSGKSWLALAVAISVATGKPLFGRFETTKSRVLIIDNELHPTTSASRLRKMVDALGVDLGGLSGQLFIDNQRGRTTDALSMAGYFNKIERGYFGLIIADALYRLLPPKTSENDNAAATALYNAFDRYSHQTGAAMLLVHHVGKGLSSERSVTDTGAGAGAMSRAADSHIVLRPHEEDDAVVLEAVTRSFPQPQPLVLRWNWPLFTPDDTLNPDDLRTSNRRKRTVANDFVSMPARAIKKVWGIEDFVRDFIRPEPQTKAELHISYTMNSLSNRKGDDLLSAALTRGLAYRWGAPGREARFSTVPEPLIRAL
jgi:AAA domain